MADVSDDAVPAAVVGGRLLELFSEERFAELAGELSRVVGQLHASPPVYSSVVEWILLSINAVVEERIGRPCDNEVFVLGIRTAGGTVVSPEALPFPLSTVAQCVEALFDRDMERFSGLLYDTADEDRLTRIEVVLDALAWLDGALT